MRALDCSNKTDAPKLVLWEDAGANRSATSKCRSDIDFLFALGLLGDGEEEDGGGVKEEMKAELKTG